ncbi:MAG: hypothetical protein E7813_16485 [Bradyrhizobium sp.]|uniref:hypothetical protein n=1 Tax=Bradyrhizobium sp. TaxID=376 RepID=UPI00120E6E0F|nr:hypothetical protein [Bradyrhizobium sp.]THD64544.1 MAG: hypothetical protein E7813_16485 [Bradyrhizobium sp.]
MTQNALPDSSRRVETLLLGIILATLGFCWIYRKWLFGHFDVVFGNEGDAQGMIVVLEHWHHVFSGATPNWRSPPFFYPEPGVLGYTDTSILYALEYAALRALSFDPYVSFMTVLATLSILGFAGFMRLAIVDFEISGPNAAVGAFLFAFANMMTMKMEHAQSYCAMLLPFVIHMTAAAYRSRGRLHSIVLGFAAGLLLGLMLFSAYLISWFFVTGMMLTAVFLLILFGPRRTYLWVHDLLTTKRYAVLGLAAGLAVGLAPFFYTYLPVLLQGRRRAFSEVREFSPRFADIVNIGDINWMWTKLFRTLGISDLTRRPRAEVSLGYTPGVAAVCVLFMIVAWRRWCKNAVALSARDTVLLAIGFTMITYWLLQLDYNGFMPWRIIWTIFPGAGAIRTTFRAQIVLNLGAALIVAAALDALLLQGYNVGRARIAAAALAVFLVAEQTADPASAFSRSEQLAWQSRIPAPPDGCRYFYVTPKPTLGGSGVWGQDQTEPMIVAVMKQIPTVNGYSTWSPIGWNIRHPADDSYPQGVRDWVTTRDLKEGICGLDPRGGQWKIGLP